MNLPFTHDTDNSTEGVSIYDCKDMDLRGQEARSCRTMNITVERRDIGVEHYYPEVKMTLYNPDPDVHPAAKRLQENLVCGHTTSEVPLFSIVVGVARFYPLLFSFISTQHDCS